MEPGLADCKIFSISYVPVQNGMLRECASAAEYCLALNLGKHIASLYSTIEDG